MYKTDIEPLLSDLVEKICQAGSPEKIILFGSRARGDAGADSDIDLLVVESSSLPRYKRPARYRKAVAGLCVAKDIIVWSPEEIDEWKGVSNAFITTILREGRVLYEA
ncbi:MAG: nucleotidyltransferase domain-containing protein [Mariprofundaceae bacterium]|nr:nucleotidyltransferase domain-containing protein [Mariprofundaceae bacterium]